MAPDTLTMLLIVLTVAVAAPLIVDRLPSRLTVSSVVVEVLLGIVVGPAVLGLVTDTDVISAFADLGLAFVMFLAGYETTSRADPTGGTRPAGPRTRNHARFIESAASVRSTPLASWSSLVSGTSGARRDLEATVDDYPLLELFWTMLWFFLFIAWIWLLITLIADIFRSRDMSGWAKALWVLFIIILPILGALVYLIVRGGSMAERAAEDYQNREQAFREYVQGAAGSGISVGDELTKLATLREAGTITEEEFQSQKAKLLA